MSELRIVDTSELKARIIDLIYQSNFHLPSSVDEKIKKLSMNEKSGIGKAALDILIENARIALSEEIPLCQDCGVVIVFVEIGQDISLRGEYLYDVINQSVEEAYTKFYLRKSVVQDPLLREGHGKNTPCTIHTDIVKGDRIRLTVYLKGGGSENMTLLRMFRPTASTDEIIDYIKDSVMQAGANPCPPLFLGLGIGGTADLAMLNSKKAVLRKEERHANPFYAELESRIEYELNRTGIGPLGFGGTSTVACVCIQEAPTHIATLPVAINMNCHSLRYNRTEI